MQNISNIPKQIVIKRYTIFTCNYCIDSTSLSFYSSHQDNYILSGDI